jgi:hypothetical protein
MAPIDSPNQVQVTRRNDGTLELRIAAGFEGGFIELLLPRSVAMQLNDKITVWLQMDPSGMIAIQTENLDYEVSSEELPLDVLVSQSTKPEMLEDEPNASAMLHRLKERLDRARLVVDEALLAAESKVQG